MVNTNGDYKYSPVAGQKYGDGALSPHAQAPDESEDKINSSSMMVSVTSSGIHGNNVTSRKFLYLAACIG